MMGTPRLRRHFFLPALLLLCAFPLRGQTAWTAETDWEKAELRITVEASVPRSGANLPAADLAAEARVARELPGIFVEAAGPILVDSRHSIRDLAQREPALGTELLQSAELGARDLPGYSRDLRRIILRFTYPLRKTLAPLFIRHKETRRTPVTPGWRPTKEFTGLVIYAKGKLPVHGERREDRLRPCLFPEIFDSRMEPVFLTPMGKPDYLTNWGSAAYTSSFDEGPWRDRIGKEPFRVIATGLFGIHPANPVIPREDAERFLAGPSARRILSEGRILIICDLD